MRNREEDKIREPAPALSLESAEPAPSPAAKPAASEESTTPRYTVAKGTSVTSLRGTLGEFESVSARDFVHGQKTLDELIAAGAVKKS